MRELLILSVGTSLLSNDGGSRNGNKSSEVENYTGDRKEHRRKLDVRALDITYCIDTYERYLLPNISSELSYRSNPHEGPKDILPQEMSYLALRAKPPRGDAPTKDWQPEVVLLASDTNAGKFCAEVIKQLVESDQSEYFAPYTNMVIKVIQGLGLDDTEHGEDEPADRFESQGIPYLLKTIRDFTAEPSQHDRITLNFTGGFKGAIPYTTLAAQLIDHRDVRMEYLYGETARIVSLPRYPIGLDYRLWDTQSALLDAATKSSGATADAFTSAMLPRMQALGRELDSLEKEGTLPNLLHKAYEAARDADPLREYCKSVIEQFLPERGDLSEPLKGLLENAGELIWLGDKLPMAADHAGRHHRNLLELAQVFLTPLLPLTSADGRPFLTPEERFVLLGALLLHDCGHTLDRMPHRLGGEIVLFRSEVRDLHQFLAFERITKNLEPKLNWDSASPLGKLVAWTCVYHRKRMGWDNLNPDERGKGRCPFTGENFSPPMKPEGPLKHAIAQCPEVDFPKVVALLRLIDGCDNQSRRVGREEQRKFFQAALEYDEASYRARLHTLLPLYEKVPDHPKADTFVEELKQWTDGAPPAFDWEVRDHFAELRANGSATPAMGLWTELARLADECAIRSRQEPHFLKHALIKKVSLLPGPEFDPKTHWHFIVQVDVDDPTGKLDDKEMGVKFKDALDPHETFRKWIGGELKAELDLNTPPTPSAPLQYLAECSGRAWSLTYHWSDRPDLNPTFTTRQTA